MEEDKNENNNKFDKNVKFEMTSDWKTQRENSQNEKNIYFRAMRCELRVKKENFKGNKKLSIKQNVIIFFYALKIVFEDQNRKQFNL